MEKLILASKVQLLPDEFVNNGFTRMDHGSIIKTFEKNGLWLGPREYLEQDSAFKQLIPYIVFCSSKGFLTYTRTTKGDEYRLHDQSSIGFGGHVDADDVLIERNKINLSPTLRSACYREIEEELDARNHNIVYEFGSIMFSGIVNDNSTEVGLVHIGVVTLIYISSELELYSNDSSIKNLRWSTQSDLEKERNLETWSKMIIEGL